MKSWTWRGPSYPALQPGGAGAGEGDGNGAEEGDGDGDGFGVGVGAGLGAAFSAKGLLPNLKARDTNHAGL